MILLTQSMHELVANTAEEVSLSFPCFYQQEQESERREDQAGPEVAIDSVVNDVIKNSGIGGIPNISTVSTALSFKDWG